MIDKDTAIKTATDHLAAVYPGSVKIMGFDFTTYKLAEPSAFSPGPSDRDGWRVYFNYLNGIEGHYIICVDGKSGEVYFVFAM